VTVAALDLDCDDAGIVILAHAPDMKVSDVDGLRALRDGITHLFHDGGIHFGIEQHAAAIAQQTEGPRSDHHGADQAHDRIQPGQPSSMPPSRAAMAMTDVAASAITCR
jgi:hypothetical protein